MLNVKALFAAEPESPPPPAVAASVAHPNAPPPPTPVHGPEPTDAETEFAASLERLAGLPPARQDDTLGDWESAEPWTDTTPTCPTCGTAATWTDGMGKVRCLKCDPARRARKLASTKAIILSSRKGGLSEAAAARQFANGLRRFGC